MKKTALLILLSVLYLPCFRAAAQTVIANSKDAATIVVDNADAIVVHKTAQMLAADIEAVVGSRPDVATELPRKAPTIVVAGTLNVSPLISRLQESGKIDASAIEGEWERYMIATVRNPFPGISRAVVIAGSDRRGTAYGLLSLSEAMGVSPWTWWADVPYPHKDRLAVPKETFVSKAPSVKYRGVFINDEDWGLLPWASKTFDPEYGNIGPKTYSKVCELLLRMRGNYLCPAMHRRSVAFNEDPQNKMVADSFGIVMGSVHCEPLLYNNAREWNKKVQGDWNYESNGTTIRQVLIDRVRSNGMYENVYTLALRGLHDKAMEGTSDMEERKSILESALADQRKILEDELGLPAETIPQAFTPYKEVLDLYNRGMALPDDVTIIWPDDNYAYFKQLSNPQEQKRSGRAGVYYHVSYHGKPHDYLWICTTPPALMYEELDKAYRTGADRIWLLNAGDIKFCEYQTDLFLRMAWDMESFNFENIASDHSRWLASRFGNSESFEYLTREFYDLSFPSKPEYMGWGQEWNTRYDKQAKVTDTDWSFTSYGEAQNRLERYRKLMELSDSLYSHLPEDAKAAYYELVHYQVAGSALMNRMHLNAQRSRLYSRQGRYSAMEYGLDALDCHSMLDSLTTQYNNLFDGKWRGVASMVHGVTAHYFERPHVAESVLQASGIGVWADGEALAAASPAIHHLPVFSSALPRSRRIEIFSRNASACEWSASASQPWIRLSATNGRGDAAVEVSVDFALLSPGTHSGVVSVKSGNQEIPVMLSAFVPDTECPGGLFVEDDGVVSMPAAGYTSSKVINGVGFRTIPSLGYEGESVQLGDPLMPMQDIRDTVSYLAYDFWSFNSGSVDVYVYALPTFAMYANNTFGSDFAGVNPATQEMRYGLSIDDAYVAVPSIQAAEYSQAWSENVLRNCNIRKTTLNVAAPGRHTLKILCADPGVVLQKIVIDFGGLRRSLLGPRSTYAVPLAQSVTSRQSITRAVASNIGGPLGSHLDRTRRGRVSTFITDAQSPAVLLFSEEQYTSKMKSWKGEHVGKWLCAASDLYRHTGNEDVLKSIRSVADFMVSRQQSDGWLGCYVPEIRFNNPGIGPGWDVWINTYNMKGLVAAYNASGDAKYLRSASRIADFMYETFIVRAVPFGDTGYHGGLVATGSIEPLAELYAAEPSPKIMELIRFCMEQMESIPELGLISKFAAGKDAQTVGNGKIYEQLRNLTGLARVARMTSNPSLTKLCRNAWKNIRDQHLSPSGCPWGGVHVHNEVFNPEGFFAPLQVCETCSAMEWLHFTMEMLSLDGEACYAEELEKTIYNAIPGALGGEASEWVYYTRLNGAVHRGNEWSCCWSSGMMASENIPDILYSKSGDDVFVNVYSPSVLDNILEQSGNYPETGDVTLRLLSSGRRKMYLRKPEWASESSVLVNGKPVALTVDHGYICIDRDWTKGDSVELAFPVIERRRMVCNSEDGSHWSVSLKGPLLLGRSSSGAMEDAQPMYQLPWSQPSEEYEYWNAVE